VNSGLNWSLRGVWFLPRKAILLDQAISPPALIPNYLQLIGRHFDHGMLIYQF